MIKLKSYRLSYNIKALAKKRNTPPKSENKVGLHKYPFTMASVKAILKLLCAVTNTAGVIIPARISELVKISILWNQVPQNVW